MKIFQSAWPAFLSLLLSAAPFCAQAADTRSADRSAAIPKTAVAPKPSSVNIQSQRPIPFRGLVKAVDPSSSTFTIGERKFTATPECKFATRDNQPAKLKDVKVGDWVTGSYRKNSQGALLAGSLYIGGKSPSSASLGTNRRASATNKVSSVRAPATH